MANGLADDLVSTLLLAVDPRRIMIAPAMNEGMWNHPATCRNAKRLFEDGVQFIVPGSGGAHAGRSGWGGWRSRRRFLRRWRKSAPPPCEYDESAAFACSMGVPPMFVGTTKTNHLMLIHGTLAGRQCHRYYPRPVAEVGEVMGDVLAVETGEADVVIHRTSIVAWSTRVDGDVTAAAIRN